MGVVSSPGLGDGRAQELLRAIALSDTKPDPAPELSLDISVVEDLLGKGGLAHAPRSCDGHHLHRLQFVVQKQLLH